MPLPVGDTVTISGLTARLSDGILVPEKSFGTTGVSEPIPSSPSIPQRPSAPDYNLRGLDTSLLDSHELDLQLPLVSGVPVVSRTRAREHLWQWSTGCYRPYG